MILSTNFFLPRFSGLHSCKKITF